MKILLLVRFLLISSISVWAFETTITYNCEDLKIKKFNYSEEVDFNGNIESFLDVKTNTLVYLIPMQNSQDFLLAYDDETSSELTSFAFINMEPKKSVFKDINNRKNVLSLYSNEDGEFFKLEYFEENDSKEGYALAKGCMGGSTIACIDIAVTACSSYAWCAVMCGVTWQYCLSAIAVSCAIACNF